MPLKPSVEARVIDGRLVAEFWDCLRMDLAPILKLQELYDRHLRDGGKADLILDLGGVEFVGSSVLGGILRIHRTAGKNDARLVMYNVDPTVRDAFRVSHVENLFVYVDDQESAFRYLATSRNGAGGPAPTEPTAEPSPTPSPSPSPTPSRKSSGPLSARRKAPKAGS